jgi:hypothetical protein
MIYVCYIYMNMYTKCREQIVFITNCLHSLSDAFNTPELLMWQDEIVINMGAKSCLKH